GGVHGPVSLVGDQCLLAQVHVDPACTAGNALRATPLSSKSHILATKHEAVGAPDQLPARLCHDLPDKEASMLFGAPDLHEVAPMRPQGRGLFSVHECERELP